MKIEGAIDKFEVTHAAREQPVHRDQESIKRKSAHRNVQRGKAEFALERQPREAST